VIELVGGDTGVDLPDRPPADPQQLRQKGLHYVLGEERRHMLEIARARSSSSGPRHRVDQIAAARAAKPPQFPLDHGRGRAQVKMPLAPVLDIQPVPHARIAHPPSAPQPDGHDHPPGSLSIRFNAVVIRTSPSFIGSYTTTKPGVSRKVAVREFLPSSPTRQESPFSPAALLRQTGAQTWLQQTVLEHQPCHLLETDVC
jgi:hypothetical protein